MKKYDRSPVENIDKKRSQMSMEEVIIDEANDTALVENKDNIASRKVIQGFAQRFFWDFLAIVMIFSVALGISQLYLNESEVNNPIRADAGQYTLAAFNLYNYGIYSDEWPKENQPHQKRTDLAPGYPLFLMLFMSNNLDIDKYNHYVQQTQVVLGAFIAICTYLLARAVWAIPWAIVAGIMTALNPHLIAMNGYILTETVFTFVMLLGTLLLMAAWRRDNYYLTLLGSIILAFSFYVRYINKLFLFTMALIFLVRLSGKFRSEIKSICMHFILVLLGYLIVQGAYHEFRAWSVTHEGGIIFGKARSDIVPPKTVENLYGKVETPLNYLRSAFRPPNFFIKNETHVYLFHKSGEYKSNTMTKGSYWANLVKYPGAYLKWMLGGKIYLIWHWDNSYNGDVYIYPMHRKGFDENLLLKVVHQTMHLIHWPLFLLTLTAPLILFVRWRKKRLTKAEKSLLIPLIGLAYFLFFLFFLNWLPRYSIPARPFSHVLATATLFWLYQLIPSIKQRCNNLLAEKQVIGKSKRK